jgi:serine/threonine protein kinase
LLLNPTVESDVKVADFGLAAHVDAGVMLFDAVGTPNYIAPEILLCLEQEPEGYNVEVDMWSAGVILYILLCGFPPFFAEDDEELYDSIIDGKFKFLKPWWDEISDSAKDLVSHLLCTDPDLRYKPHQVFEHPWMKGHAPDKPLAAAQEELRKFNAKRRWKSAILTVVAANKFKTMMDMKRVREAKPRKAKNLRLSSIKNFFGGKK